MENNIKLVTTSTCPNCGKAKELLDKHNIKYELIDAAQNIDFCKECQIFAAPTLIVGDAVYTNLSNIIKYVEENY